MKINSIIYKPVFVLLICISSCKNPEINPLFIQKNEVDFTQQPSKVEVIDGSFSDSIPNLTYHLSYLENGKVESIKEYYIFDLENKLIDSSISNYTYINENLATKQWEGYVNQGIHGHTIHSITNYHFAYDASNTLTSVFLKDNSSIGMLEKATWLSTKTPYEIAVVIESNFKSWPDTMKTYKGEITPLFFSSDLYSNQFFMLSYERYENDLYLYQDNQKQALATFSTKKNMVNFELWMLLNDLFNNKGKLPERKLFTGLRTDTYFYFDPFIKASLEYFPVRYKDVNYIYQFDHFDRIVSIRTDVASENEIRFYY